MLQINYSPVLPVVFRPIKLVHLLDGASVAADMAFIVMTKLALKHYRDYHQQFPIADDTIRTGQRSVFLRHVIS